MFTYFHCYLPETWAAQVKAGLVTKKTGGIRQVMSIRLDEDHKFNRIAAKGGALYHIIAENGYPLYIDRLQGGDYINPYDYDMELVQEYKNLLGDKFFGFQMHEWLSNYKHDLGCLSGLRDEDWTAENITKEVFRQSPYPFLNLSFMTAEEMQEDRPKRLADFVAVGEKIYARRQKQTGGDLISCDSYFLTFATEIKHGTRAIMPEIGHQTPNTRIQLAFARGMCKAHGIRFGAYYESWGGHPFSVCCYQKDGLNEWGIKQASDFPYEMKGSNGGSSRSLQKRLHLVAYMAGVTFMSEEWGMCNTFCDWQNFELSPYGKTKLDFIRFVEKYDDIGAPVTPVAVVVPGDFVVESANFRKNHYIGFAVQASFARKCNVVHAGLKKIFASTSPIFGRETRALRNCKTYDCIDIITADEADMTRYEALVDLTSNPTFAQKHKSQIVSADIKTLNNIIENHLPCSVKGGVLKQFTRRSDGAYYMLLTNNGGITNTVKQGEKISPCSTRRATITLKPHYTLTTEQTDGRYELSDNVVTVTLRAGEYYFAKISESV